jgi:hypothetical protein
VSAVHAGLANVRASISASNTTVATTSAILVEPGSPPQLAYTLRGELRDVNNTEIANSHVSLMGIGNGSSRVADVVTTSDGSFRFFPVPAGQYLLSAQKANYRPNQKMATVPSDRPTILVLLAEPPELVGAINPTRSER